MSMVDLSQLMGGKNFTVLCTLFKNRSGVKTTALANTRANAFALLDTKCAQEMSRFLNVPLDPLEKPIPVKGYNGHVRKPINSILQTNLQVNGQRLYNMPFLVTDLGNYSVILGCKWLLYLNILLDI